MDGNVDLLDPDSGARLSQFRFRESSRTREAALRVSLPDRPGEEVAMDRPIPFYVLAIPRDRQARRTRSAVRRARSGAGMPHRCVTARTPSSDSRSK